jgi:DNA-binding LacI/PurR family transcriptional regulator
MGGPDKKQPERKRLKMADIARIAGVDVSTISRAFADSPRVTAETKERIRKVVAETGYIVNHNARQLRAQRIRPYPRDASQYRQLELCRDRAGGRGCGSRRGPECRHREYSVRCRTRAGAGEQLVTGAVDGLDPDTGRVPPIVTEMADFNRRIVAVSRPSRVTTSPSSASTIWRPAAPSPNTWCRLGHKRIAHLAGPLESPVFRARRDSYLAVMQEAGLSSLARTVVAPSYDLGGGRLGMQEMLADGNIRQPSSAAAMKSPSAPCRRRGPPASLLPRDMAFSGFDDVAISEAYEPPLTTIRIPRRKIGERGARMLLQSLDMRKARPRSRSVDYELIVRASTTGTTAR